MKPQEYRYGLKIYLLLLGFLMLSAIAPIVEAAELRSTTLSAGPFSLSSLWGGILGNASINSVSVKQIAEITQGGIAVNPGKSISFGYIPDLPSFSIGGGELASRTVSGSWGSSVGSGCSATTTTYKIGSDSFIFKLCAIKPSADFSSSNASVMTCSGTTCTAVSTGTTRITANIASTSLQIWSSNNGGASWTTATGPVSLSPTSLTWDIVVAPAPIISFSAASYNVNYGTGTTLTWSTQNADSCTADVAWTGTKALSGTWNTGPLYQTSNFYLICTGPGGTTTRAVQILVGSTNPAPTLNFSASSLTVNQGSAVTLTWSTTNADSCEASAGDWSGIKPTSGSESTGPLVKNSSYTLKCTGPGGSLNRTLNISVNIPDSNSISLNFSANDTTLVPGQSTTLNWSSSNAASCTASGGIAGWDGSRPLSGTYNTGSLTSDTTYVLTCVGPSGSITKKVYIVMVEAPTLNFWADATKVNFNQTTVLRWTSQNTSSCTLSYGTTTSSVALSGSKTTPALSSTRTFTLTCVGPGGTISRAVTITVDAPTASPTLTFTADNYSVPYLGSTTLRWASQNASSCRLDGASVAISGSKSTGALSSTKTYVMTCTNPAGSVTRSVTINVATPPEYDNLPNFEFWADAYEIYVGDKDTLHWRTTNAHWCVASGQISGWDGSKSINGDQTFSLYSTTTFFMTCGNNIGSQTRSVTIRVTNPYPSLTFTADSTLVPYNTSTTLRWESQRATSCTASNAWSGSKPLSGSELTTNITSDKTYQLTCINNYGSTTRTITLRSVNDVGPSISFWADSFSVPPGGATNLRWATENASSCMATGDWSGSRSTSGSTPTGILTKEKEYILKCSNAAGVSSSMTVKIKINDTSGPALSFWADSINVAPNTATILHWQSANVTSCVASGDWSGEKMLSGSESTGILTSQKTYILRCEGPSGKFESILKVAVGAANAEGPKIDPFGAHDYAVPYGTTTGLYWNSINTQTCTLTDPNGNTTIVPLNSPGFPTGNITAKVQYTLRCEGYGMYFEAYVDIVPASLIICPSQNPITIYEGKTQQLEAWYLEGVSFTCENKKTAANKTLESTWTSDNSTIAKVADGLVTGVNSGMTKIYAAYSGSKASKQIIVIPKIDCWQCDTASFACNKFEKGGSCDASLYEYTNEQNCKTFCHDFKWKEIAP